MIKPNLPKHESQRLEALKDYHILDTVPEESYQDIVSIAAQICNVPVALISLVDEKRQWIKAKIGIPEVVSEIPREYSCCGHAILDPENILEVQDAQKDERFCDNPLSLNDPHIKFYAGAPLVTSEGQALGTLCVIDHVPRKLTKEQRKALWALSRQVMSLLNLRKDTEQFNSTHGRLLEIIENISDAVYELDDRGKFVYVNPTLCRLTKYSEAELLNSIYFDLIRDDFKQELGEFYYNQIKNKEDSSYYEFPMVAKDGETIWIGQTVKIFYDKHQDRVLKVGAVARDITELKRVREELQEREELYRLVSENSSDLVCLHEPDGTYKYISPAVIDLVGCTPDTLIGKSPYDYIHPDDEQRVRTVSHNVSIEEKIDTSVSYRLRSENDQYIWVETVARPILNENEEVIAIQTATRDISGRKKNEEIIKREQANLEALIENTPDVIWSIDTEDRYIAFNKPFVKTIEFLTNSTPHVGDKVDFGSIENDLGQLLKKLHKRALSGERFMHNIEWLENPVRTFEHSFNPIIDEDKKVIGVSVFARDITKRIQENKNRERFKDGLALLNELSSATELDYGDLIDKSLKEVLLFLDMDVILLGQIANGEIQLERFYDRTGKIPIEKGGKFNLNQTLCEITYDVQGIVAIGETGCSKKPTSEHPLLRQEAYLGAPVMIGSQPYGTICLQSATKRTAPFDSYDKEFLGLYARWIGAILERKQYEKLLLESREKALIASEAKANFLSTMSHEIRTPLNAIIGMTHFILEDNPKQSQLENLKLLRFSGENLLALVNDILDINRIESDNLVLEQADFNLKELLESIRQSSTFNLEEKGLECKLYYDLDLPEVFKGDSIRITQVINNLVNNAIKFTEEGKVEIIAKSKGFSDGNCKVYLEIRDSGIGISEEEQKWIFERFTQAKSSTTREYGGSGLGLTIVKSILELMDSHIEVNSIPGEGSKFYFEIDLPLSNQAVRNKNHFYQADLVSLSDQNITILLVEDNKVNQVVAEKFLTKWGIKVEIAENGKEAVALVRKKSFDLILMDLQMPIMDGYLATKKIRSMNKDLPILALTSSTQMSEKKRALEEGMNDYLIKPLTPSHLYSKITKYVEIKGLISENVTKKIQPKKSSGFQMLTELIEKDPSFKNEIIPLYIENIRSIRDGLPKKIKEKDTKGAEKLRHKMLTTLNTLDANEILSLMDQGIRLINHGENGLRKTQYLKTLHSACDQMELDLETLMN